MMGGATPLCRALIGLSMLLISAGELRQISQGDDCSQPDMPCTIKSSSCFDINWFRPFIWTPNAPSHMEVQAGVGLNELGFNVSILRINWTISMDASILYLQGVEISVLEQSTQKTRCVQFQFNKTFSSQRNPYMKPWKFYYNNFEVTPGNTYYVTVQHLPKMENFNSREQKFTMPPCTDHDMMQTDTCYNLGLRWFPAIGIKHQGENLTVEFNTRWDSREYGVQVKVGDEPSKYEPVSILQGPAIQRVQVTFPHIGGYIDKECVYNITVWPYMPSCGTDCMRQYYSPPCATETPPLPEVVELWYLWSVAVLLAIMLFGGIFLALRLKDYFKTPEKKVLPPIKQPITFPTKKKVWLVYSADHRSYFKVVVSLADFMRSAWGLDVVLDRLHLKEMGTIGPMAWLGRQKDEIERTNGTILILCSRGVQEKWKAMQTVGEQITLREDREHPIEDLFTPALSLILPDFQKAMPYDRYVVAYFSGISTLSDIPSLLEICPKNSLPENLQDLFFRIQRQEQYHPHIQLTVSYEKQPSYQHLVKAMERCKKWQERNVGWFERECLMMPFEDLEDSEEEVDDNVTRKVCPFIRYPETSASVVEPLILNPDPAQVIDPTIVIGTQSIQIEPFLPDMDPSVSVVQPLFRKETSAVACIQEPYLVGEDPSLGELSERLLKQDVFIHSDQGIHSDQSILSIEQVGKAQERFFPNILESLDISSAMEFMEAGVQDLGVPIMDVARDQPVGEQFQEIFFEGHVMTPAVDPGTGLPDGHSVQLADQGYSTWNPYEMDLKAIHMESLKLFLQNEGGLLNLNEV